MDETKNEMYTAKVSSQENIHIPKKVCDKLDLSEGDTIAFVFDGDNVFVRKATVTVEV